MAELRAPRKTFIHETFLLSKASPVQWEVFVAALREYVASEIETSVRAAPDTALVAHGRAQALLAFRDDVSQIEKLWKQMTDPKRS